MHISLCLPRVLAALEPWAEISQRLRRICVQIRTLLWAEISHAFGVFVFKFELYSGLKLANAFGVFCVQIRTLLWAEISQRLRRICVQIRTLLWAEISLSLRRTSTILQVSSCVPKHILSVAHYRRS